MIPLPGAPATALLSELSTVEAPDFKFTLSLEGSGGAARSARGKSPPQNLFPNFRRDRFY